MDQIIYIVQSVQKKIVFLQPILFMQESNSSLARYLNLHPLFCPVQPVAAQCQRWRNRKTLEILRKKTFLILCTNTYIYIYISLINTAFVQIRYWFVGAVGASRKTESATSTASTTNAASPAITTIATSTASTASRYRGCMIKINIKFLKNCRSGPTLLV